ncbi:SsgA family sporulation/cell division regulator [Pseudonocardia sp. GCM10023141]|uniref:SsgA family sporulation/cell division regulator n=1 Tax=Pseudonocardia sp. GCM10023141 TaxID=3252653 RepID=UPI0036070757
MTAEYTRRILGYLIGTDGTRVPLDVALTWRRADPLCVRVLFGTASVEWELSRDLLRTGLTDLVGVGDVAIVPRSGVVEVWLNSHEGTASIELSARDVELFLESIDLLMPELEVAVELAVDAAIRQLLSLPGGAA